LTNLDGTTIKGLKGCKINSAWRAFIQSEDSTTGTTESEKLICLGDEPALPNFFELTDKVLKYKAPSNFYIGRTYKFKLRLSYKAFADSLRWNMSGSM
jgi:hypothetical protein